MGYEIDYLAVGEGAKSADAICLRYGTLIGQPIAQTVIAIDGGTLESGEALVSHIKKYYGTDTVNIALLTHPDTDHASGMRQILENLKVKQLVMHLPWNHSADVKALLDDSRVTTNAIREKAKRNLSAAHEIEQIALRKGIPIFEPFAGAKTPDGVLTILGPTKEFYQEMLAGFKFMPEAELSSPVSLLAEALRAFGSTVAKWIAETWFTETLQEPSADATSPENNSSVIFKLEVSGKNLLFTGDAGVPAIQSAIRFADANGIALAAINFFDVPHHGSRRNFSPSIANRLFGNIRQNDAKDWTAFISAAKGGEPKHPHKRVTNALRRRGAAVHVTAGRNIWHSWQAPPRADYGAIESVPFYPQVEDDD